MSTVNGTGSGGANNNVDDSFSLHLTDKDIANVTGQTLEEHRYSMRHQGSDDGSDNDDEEVADVDRETTSSSKKQAKKTRPPSPRSDQLPSATFSDVNYSLSVPVPTNRSSATPMKDTKGSRSHGSTFSSAYSPPFVSSAATLEEGEYSHLFAHCYFPKFARMPTVLMCLAFFPLWQTFVYLSAGFVPYWMALFFVFLIPAAVLFITKGDIKVYAHRSFLAAVALPSSYLFIAWGAMLLIGLYTGVILVGLRHDLTWFYQHPVVPQPIALHETLTYIDKGYKVFQYTDGVTLAPRLVEVLEKRLRDPGTAETSHYYGLTPILYKIPPSEEEEAGASVEVAAWYAAQSPTQDEPRVLYDFTRFPKYGVLVDDPSLEATYKGIIPQLRNKYPRLVAATFAPVLEYRDREAERSALLGRRASVIFWSRIVFVLGVLITFGLLWMAQSTIQSTQFSL